MQAGKWTSRVRQFETRAIGILATGFCAGESLSFCKFDCLRRGGPAARAAGGGAVCGAFFAKGAKKKSGIVAKRSPKILRENVKPCEFGQICAAACPERPEQTSCCCSSSSRWWSRARRRCRRPSPSAAQISAHVSNHLAPCHTSSSSSAGPVRRTARHLS